MKIFVIDDHSDIRTLVRLCMEKMEHSVTECSSGKEAISLLSKNRSFDLIICDYHMPDGNGLEVLKYLSSIGASLKFILFSSFTGLKTSISYEPFLGIVSKDELENLVKIIDRLEEKSCI